MTSIETLLFGRGIRSLKPGLLIYNEMWQDGEHRTTRGAWEPPDGDATQADSEVVRVTGQASTATTARLMFELKAKSQEKGENTFEKRLAVAKQLKVGRFILKINCDGPVFTGLAGCGSHGHPQGQMVDAVDDQG